MAILLKGEPKMAHSLFLACYSQNATQHSLISFASPRPAHTPVFFCSLHTFILTCPTVVNPTKFSLGLPNYDVSSYAHIRFRTPVQEKLPVVSCVSSLYFAERFQQLVVSIEMYSHFGVNRQAYYLLSALEGIHELLEEYEKTRVIDLYNWWLPEIDEYQAKTQLATRDQVGAINDCFLNYREAADFIIVHDIDDLILTDSGRDFHTEFKFLWSLRPLTAYFQYPSFAAVSRTSKSVENFDIFDMVNSLVINDHPWDGKSVYNTSLVETVWIHWADFYDHKLSGYLLPSQEGIVVHARHLNFDMGKNRTELMMDTLNTPQSQNKMDSVNKYYPNITNLLSTESMRQIQLNFDSRMTQFLINNPGLAKKLYTKDYYYKLADECVSKIGGFTYKKVGCRTNYACQIPVFPGVTCVQTKQKLVKKIFNKYMTIYVPEGNTEIDVKYDGCTVN